MSDDLVKRLREHIAVVIDNRGHVFENELLCDQAADRIGELQAKLERTQAQIEWLEELLWAAEDDAKEAEAYADQAADRIEELEANGLANRVAIMRLEAKLAQAVKFVECAINYAKTCGARFPMDEACTTLAELTGGKDDKA